MPSHPLSLRKTRGVVQQNAVALGATVEQVNKQRELIVKVAGAANQATSVLGRNFSGRLRWLFLGK